MKRKCRYCKMWKRRYRTLVRRMKDEGEKAGMLEWFVKEIQSMGFWDRLSLVFTNKIGGYSLVAMDLCASMTNSRLARIEQEVNGETK